MRIFAWLLALSTVAAGCRPNDDIVVLPERPELVVISLPRQGDRLIFLLPGPEWQRIEERVFGGFLYAMEGRTLRVRIVLSEDGFEGVVDAARAASPGQDVRGFQVGRGWPFVGIVLSYAGHPDRPMLDDFIRSFRLERD